MEIYRNKYSFKSSAPDGLDDSKFSKGVPILIFYFFHFNYSD